MFCLTKYLFLFWQSIPIFDKAFLSFNKVFLSFNKVFVHFRLFPNPQISFWQSRELKPDLISQPHTLTSMIPGFPQTIIFLVIFFTNFSLFSNHYIYCYFFWQELQNKILLDESWYFAFEHYLSEVLNPKLMRQKAKFDESWKQNNWSLQWPVKTLPMNTIPKGQIIWMSLN